METNIFEILIVLLVLFGISFFIWWFRKLPKSKREIYAKRKRNERRDKKRDYKDFHEAKIEAEENARNRRFLQNVQPFDLVGKNSNATRFRNHLLGK